MAAYCIYFQSMEMANPYTYSDSSNSIKSDVKSISLTGANGTNIVVENATEPFEIILAGADTSVLCYLL